MLTRLRHAALCLSLLLPGTALAQFAGDEFHVPRLVPGGQSQPDVAASGSRFVIVWKGQGTVNGSATTGILARRFTTAGVPLGEDQLDDNVNAVLDAPRIAEGSGFLVVWREDNGGDEADSDVYARLYSGNSGAVGSPFRVNTWTTFTQIDPVVAGVFFHGFVVAWDSPEPVSSAGHAIYAQRLSINGNPIGGEFRVNTVTTEQQTQPTVAMFGDGGFVVAWTSPPVGGDNTNIYFQRFDASGQKLGSEVRPHTDQTGDQIRPAVSADLDGSFVIAWESPDGGGNGVFARRYSGTGAALGAEFRVNLSTAGNQEYPSVAVTTASFVVTWTDKGGGPALTEVWARSFDADGTPHAPFTVNTYTTGEQTLSRVGAATDSRNYVIVWQDDDQEGLDFGVYARKLCLAGDANGDGNVNVSDILFLINHLFAGGPEPLGCADANDDLAVNVSDVLFLINYLFAGGPEPG